jgi:hypothetical protein
MISSPEVIGRGFARRIFSHLKTEPASGEVKSAQNSGRRHVRQVWATTMLGERLSAIALALPAP